MFSAMDGFIDMPVSVPCGQCIGCRIEKRRQWTMRIMHEMELHDESCFVTLTYDDKQCPKDGSLERAAMPDFMKKLRMIIRREDEKIAELKQCKPEYRKLRFYGAGEYGPSSLRPHYHLVLFGIDFNNDRYAWAKRKGNQSWRSPTLERAWTKGHSEIGSLTWDSAQYVAGYVVDKITGEQAEDHYERVDPGTGEYWSVEPEFAQMSRRPGIGAGWLEKYGEETYRDDSVVVRGREMRPPKYYDSRYVDVDEAAVQKCKNKRQRARNESDEEYERLLVRESITKARHIFNARKGEI